MQHLLRGTDGLGAPESGAVAARSAEGEVHTLCFGCNGITAGGAWRIADQLHASPQVVKVYGLKHKPRGPGAGDSAGRVD